MNKEHNIKATKTPNDKEIKVITYSSYAQMFQEEFHGIAEHLLDHNGKVKRSEVEPDGEHLSDEELLKAIIHEILEIPDEKNLLQ